MLQPCRFWDEVSKNLNYIQSHRKDMFIFNIVIVVGWVIVTHRLMYTHTHVRAHTHAVMTVSEVNTEKSAVTSSTYFHC